MAAHTRVALYFDFVSPYSWLALTQVESFGTRFGVEWSLRPVVYGALLDAHGLIGPAEVEVKRRYTFHDVARCAFELGLRVQGPPAHPFRSLDALRTVCLFLEDPRALSLAVALADACWAAGRPLTDLGVVGDVVNAVGLDGTGLAGRIADPAVKGTLRALTDSALRAGVFGVPTFELRGELFWGHDRMEALARRLEGGPAPDAGWVEQALARPRGTDRKQAPGERGGASRS